MAGMTAIWQYSPKLCWKMHEVVREANPHWNPPTEGYEPSARRGCDATSPLFFLSGPAGSPQFKAPVKFL